MERPQENKHETPPSAAGVRLDEAAFRDLDKEFSSLYASGPRLGLSVQFIDWWLGKARD